MFLHLNLAFSNTTDGNYPVSMEGGLIFNNERGKFADTGDCSTRDSSYLHSEQEKVIVHMYVNLDMIPEDIAAHIPS